MENEPKETNSQDTQSAIDLCTRSLEQWVTKMESSIPMKKIAEMKDSPEKQAKPLNISL